MIIEDNVFISTEPKEIEESDALITYALRNPGTKGIAIDEEGHYITGTYEPDYACPGNLVSKIRRNKFIIKGDRQPRVINAIGNHRPGMKCTQMVKIDEFMGPARIFRGYRTVLNMISDLEFTDNEISVLDSRPAVRDYLLRFERVVGLKLANNTIKSNVNGYGRWYRDHEAVELVDCEVGADSNTKYIEGDGAWGRRIHLPLADGEIAKVRCARRLLLTLCSDERGRLSTSTDDDGNGIVTVVAEDGYRFAGWKVLDVDFSPIKGPEGNIEYLMFIEKRENGEMLWQGSATELADKSHEALDKPSGEVSD
jgi:hypothetical protein